MSGGKQLVCGKSGIRMISMTECGRSPFLMEEPPWEDDKMFPNCVKCNRKFDFTHRRHHCRRCGKVFCGNCCSHKVMLTRMSFVDPVRVCDECSKVAKKEEEFFDKHLKILCNGGRFIVDDTSPLTFMCKLDYKAHRDIVFECTDQADHEPVKLGQIIYVQLISDNEGNTMTGITLKYKEGNEVLEVKLQAIETPEADRKRALVWLVSLQRAMKMVFEVNN